MSRDVKLPSLGESVEGGTVLQILVSKGDSVSEQDPLIEIETDKATVEVPSPAAGVVQEILVSEGDEIQSGQRILVLGDDGEEPSEDEDDEERADAEEEPEPEPDEEEPEDDEPDEQEEPAEDRPEPPKREKKADKKEQPRKGQERERPKAREEAPARQRRDTPPKEEPARPARTGPRVPSAAPHVRRLARELGVDLSRVAGANADQVTSEDVKSHVRAAMARAAEPSSDTPALPDFSQWGEIEHVPLGAVRRATAATVLDSWRSVPQVTHFDRAVVSGLERFRERHGDKVEAEKISLTAILVCLLGEALTRFPAFNASIDLDRSELIVKKYVHVGIAVDTPRGLLVPVLRDVQSKGLVSVAEELSGLLDAAKKGELGPDDLSGATFTLTNVGPIGGSHFTPLVVWPQVAILGVGAEEPALLQRGGEVVTELVLPLSVSYDHRAVDGADAARFTRWFADALEDPLAMLLES